MGCDIHIAVEVRGPDRTWRLLRDGYDGDPDERDYNVFAFLANVRNGFGFAGTYRHEPVGPQFPDRGLPVDREEAAYETDDEEGLLWLGEHSFTWASFAELRDAPWGVEFTSGGVVKSADLPADYPVLGVSWIPQSWCGGIGGPGIQTMSTEEWTAAGCPRRPKLHVSVQWRWTPLVDCSYRQWVAGPLAQVAALYGEDNVRVLMGFDS